jgi:3-hydroxyacyl-CoA dehydrogenase
VRLGLIPGAGGTQRLPRLIGLAAAVDVICSSRRIAGPEALTLGMIDALAADLRRDAGAHALALPGKKRLRDKDVPAFDVADYEAAKARAGKSARGLTSVSHALRAVDLAVTLPIDDALREERAIFDEIRTGEEASALRHLFFAERNSAKLDTDARPRKLASIGVIGAGAMGSGIAVAALSAGYAVVLVDPDEGARPRAEAFVSKERRGEAAFSLRGEIDAVAQCDLVIEAIVEDMGAKRSLLAQLSILAPQAILASNTSYLDLDVLGAGLPNPERLVGLHFFNPAHRMKLLEVVKAAATAPEALATALAFGRRLGKACVIAAVGEGFIGNRIYNAYRRHCEFLVEEGASPAQVDSALRDFGFAMGPFAVGDMSGLDIAWRMRQRLAATRDPRERYVTIPDRLCEAGRLGRKTGQGWYAYDAAAPAGRPDPAVDEIIEACAREAGRMRKPISNDEIIQRALGAIINEAGLVLSEGIARSKADIDLVMVNGYGFPAYKGGPLFWAERQGHVERLIDAAAQAQGFGFRRCPDLSIMSGAALLES